MKAEEIAQPKASPSDRPGCLQEPLPWYRWHPLEWLADRRVMKLSWECNGLLRTLMDLCWIKGSIPCSREGLAELLADDPEVIGKLLPPVLPWFNVSDGMMTCPKLDEVRTAQDKKRLQLSIAGQKSGESRRKTRTNVEQMLNRCELEE